MVDAEGVAHDVPALSERDPQHEPGDQHQREDPARGRVWRPFVQVVLVQDINKLWCQGHSFPLFRGIVGAQVVATHDYGFDLYHWVRG